MIYIKDIDLEEICMYFLAEDENHIKTLSTIFDDERLINIAIKLQEVFIEKSEKDLLKYIEENFDKLYHDRIIQLKKDYYSNLAHIFNKGGMNTEIKYLLKNSNTEFKLEIEYQELLSQALIINERLRLKKLFQEIEISNVEKNQNIKGNNGVNSQFIWMKMSIAASVFGLIITSGVTQFDNRSKIELAFEKSLMIINEKNNDKAVLIEIRTNQKTSNSELEKESNVSISVKTLDDLSEISEENTLGFRKVIPIDSVNAYYAKYTFIKNNLTIYLNEKQEVELVKFQNKFFIKIDGTIYEIKKNTELSSLSLVTDKKIIKIVNTLFK